MYIQGVGISAGIAIGAAYVIMEYVADVSKKSAGPNESGRFSKAVNELAEILKKKAKSASGEQSEIIESHVVLLSDPVMLSDIKNMIINEDCNSEYAVNTVFDSYAVLFNQTGNELLMMRAGDLRDIKNNLLAVMNGHELPDLSAIPKGSIIAANELTTSLAAGIKGELVNGLVTNEGGATSHMAIIARSMGLPAVSGIGRIGQGDRQGAEQGVMQGAGQGAMQETGQGAGQGAMQGTGQGAGQGDLQGTGQGAGQGDLRGIRHGDLLVVDGDAGKVVVNPTVEELARYRALIEEHRAQKEALEKYRGVPSVTLDGRQIEICANIGLEADIERAVKADAEGIGLFRTEFLFMNRNAPPSEEEQFAAYKKAASAFGNRHVIIRTLDIGGDKEIPYLGLEKEENPFLGWRAIRYCIDSEELFIAQLRAIVRASAFGRVKVMIPMISDIRELRNTKELIDRIKSNLAREGAAFDPGIEVGIMIETPASAVMAGAFAGEAEFFSIGTNDLIQYVMAADRGNNKVAGLYSVYNPAVLRLIHHVAKEAQLHSIPCGICGEAGADPLLTRFLIGCGISELSVVGSSVLEVRSAICQMSYSEVKKKVDEAIEGLVDIEDSMALLRRL